MDGRERLLLNFSGSLQIWIAEIAFSLGVFGFHRNSGPIGRKPRGYVFGALDLPEMAIRIEDAFLFVFSECVRAGFRGCFVRPMGL
jgi:hypothetical protein